MEMLQRVFEALTKPVRAQHPNFKFQAPESFEGPLAILVDTQPSHLLSPEYETWTQFQLAAVDAVLLACGNEKLRRRKWGKVNLVYIRHPLSTALPGLGWLTDMPPEQMPGDSDMPRVSCAELGASQRFAVSPGYEADAYFTMPCGQSGHPLSPFYRAGHKAWVRGEARPFLPGAPAYALEIKPKSNSSVG